MRDGKHKYRALIADNHLLFRRGLRTLLSSEADFEIVGEVSSAQETLSCAADVRPEVIVMDAELVNSHPDDSLALQQLQSLSCCLFLTALDETLAMEKVLSTGARGYMLKTSSPGQLISAIRKAARGECQENTTETRTASDLRALAESNRRYARPNELTSREQEVTKLLAEGRTVKEAANELCLSIKTVEAHKLNLMRKLDIHNRTALAEYALKNGLVSSIKVRSR